MIHGPPDDARRSPLRRGIGGALLVAGVACDLAALVGIVEVGLFRYRSPGRANAVIVEHVSDDSTGKCCHDVLEFPAPGKTVRVHTRGPFGIVWGWKVDRDGLICLGHELGEKIPVRYSPYHPENARPNVFEYQLAVPLYLLLFGAVITPLGILVWSRGLMSIQTERQLERLRREALAAATEDEAMTRLLPLAITGAVVASGCGSSESATPKPLTKLELEADMAGRLSLSDVNLNDEGGGRFSGKGRNGDGIEVQLDVRQEMRQLSWKTKWNGKTNSGGHSEGETAGSASR